MCKRRRGWDARCTHACMGFGVRGDPNKSCPALCTAGNFVARIGEQDPSHIHACMRGMGVGASSLLSHLPAPVGCVGKSSTLHQSPSCPTHPMGRWVGQPFPLLIHAPPLPTPCNVCKCGMGAEVCSPQGDQEEDNAAGAAAGALEKGIPEDLRGGVGEEA